MLGKDSNRTNEKDVISDSTSSTLKADLTYIKDSNKLIQIDIECVDKVFPIQIELLNQTAPRFCESFQGAIEGFKVPGGMFGGTTHHKLNLRFDEAQGPLLMATQTGKSQKMIDPLLDFFYQNGSDWEKPKMTDRTAQMTKGQCIFFNYQKEGNAPLFAICMEDFQNQGFEHRTFGQVRGYSENLDIFKYRIRSISVVGDRKIVQKSIGFLGNDVKQKLNDQIKLVVRLKQLEEERKEVALSSARDNPSVNEKEELQKKLEAIESQLQKAQDLHQKELYDKSAELGQLQASLEGEKGSKAELEGKIKSKDQEMKDIVEKNTQEIQNKIQEYMQLKMENAKLKKQVETTQGDLEQALQDKENLKQAIVKEDQEKVKQKEVMKEKDTQIGALESELAAVQQSHQKLQLESNSLESSATSAATDLQRQLSEQTEAHARILASEKENFVQLKTQTLQLEKEKETMMQQMEQLEKEKKASLDKVAEEKRMAGEQTEGRVKELEADLQQKDAKLIELTKSSGDLEQAYKQSQNKLSSQVQELEEAVGNNQALKASLESANISMSEATTQTQLLKKEYDEKIQRLEQGNEEHKSVAQKGMAKVEELESKDKAQQQMITKLQDLIDQMNSQTEGTQQTEQDEGQ